MGLINLIRLYFPVQQSLTRLRVLRFHAPNDVGETAQSPAVNPIETG